MLLDGQEISDKLYVKMFIAKLRMAYEYKDPAKKAKEMKAAASRKMKIGLRLAEIEKELQEEGIKSKQTKNLNSEKSTLEVEKEALQNSNEEKGWVLLDFPSSYAQAKLLEEALTGYKPQTELNAIERDIEMEDAFLLVQPNAKEAPPKCMIQSGLDAIIWFDIEQTEVQRRADGRRIDTYEEEPRNIYNVTTITPPVDQAPLCERLEAIDEDHDHSSTITDRICSFDKEERALRRWLKLFGDEDRQRPLLHTINASHDENKVFNSIRGIIERIRHDKEQRRGFIIEMMSYKLKQMFEAKMKALLGESIGATVEEAEEAQESIGKEDELNATGDISPSIAQKSGK